MARDSVLILFGTKSLDYLPLIYTQQSDYFSTKLELALNIYVSRKAPRLGELYEYPPIVKSHRNYKFMLFLLSPAKTLDYESKLPKDTPTPTEPLFKKQSAELIAILRKCSKKEIGELMSISEALAELNHKRYLDWTPTFTQKNSRPALLAFDGDVYEGFNASTLKPKELAWAQDHLAILSGLYGVLRPLDKMQPYRLEMGTKLKNQAGANLYKFWGSNLSNYLNERLQGEKNPIVVNLASQEYFKSVDLKALNAKVIECVFEQEKSGNFKIISFLAKRARGLMARYAVEHQIKTPAGLQKFNYEGYRFEPSLSSSDKLVFRKQSV